jgi:hypothetical protein
VDAQVTRPPGGEAVGQAGGFYYEKRGGVFSAALPGQRFEQPDGRYLMALYPEELPDARPGDELSFSNRQFRILSVYDRGAYQTYHLEEIS